MKLRSDDQVMFKDWFLCEERIGFSPRYKINSYIHRFPTSLCRWLCTFYAVCHGILAHFSVILVMVHQEFNIVYANSMSELACHEMVHLS